LRDELFSQRHEIGQRAIKGYVVMRDDFLCDFLDSSTRFQSRPKAGADVIKRIILALRKIENHQFFIK